LPLETDDENREKFSPWPGFIHEDVQMQRGKTRASLKQQLSKYQEFLHGHLQEFENWWNALNSSAKYRFVLDTITHRRMIFSISILFYRLFQLDENEIMNYVKSHADVNGSYRIVFISFPSIVGSRCILINSF